MVLALQGGLFVRIMESIGRVANVSEKTARAGNRPQNGIYADRVFHTNNLAVHKLAERNNDEMRCGCHAWRALSFLCFHLFGCFVPPEYVQFSKMLAGPAHVLATLGQSPYQSSLRDRPNGVRRAERARRSLQPGWPGAAFLYWPVSFSPSD